MRSFIPILTIFSFLLSACTGVNPGKAPVSLDTSTPSPTATTTTTSTQTTTTPTKAPTPKVTSTFTVTPTPTESPLPTHWNDPELIAQIKAKFVKRHENDFPGKVIASVEDWYNNLPPHIRDQFTMMGYYNFSLDGKTLELDQYNAMGVTSGRWINLGMVRISAPEKYRQQGINVIRVLMTIRPGFDKNKTLVVTPVIEGMEDTSGKLLTGIINGAPGGYEAKPVLSEQQIDIDSGKTPFVYMSLYTVRDERFVDVAKAEDRLVNGNAKFQVRNFPELVHFNQILAKAIVEDPQGYLIGGNGSPDFTLAVDRLIKSEGVGIIPDSIAPRDFNQDN